MKVGGELLSMKFFTLSGVLEQMTNNEPRWTVRQGVEYRGRWEDCRHRRLRYHVEGTSLFVADNVTTIPGDTILDGYVYRFADNVGGFELRRDCTPHLRRGEFYLCLRTEGFGPQVIAHAHFKRPIYAESRQYSSSHCTFWLLRPEEYLSISFWGKSWEVSNVSGQILIERIGQNRRYLMYGDLDKMPDRVRLYYLRWTLAGINEEFDAVTCEIAQITGESTSRYCRPGCGNFGDPLP